MNLTRFRKAATALCATAALALTGMMGVATAHADDTTPVIGHSSALMGNGDGSYSLTVSVSSTDMDTAQQQTESDVVVLMDVSGSMTTTDMKVAKNAVNGLANQLLNDENDTVRMSIVRFSSEAKTLEFSNGSEWTHSPALVAQALNTLTSRGNTNWDGALQNASALVQGDSARKSYVVLMSDGYPNTINSCYPAVANCTDTSWSEPNAVPKAIEAANTMPNTQIYAVSTRTSASESMKELVDGINAKAPKYPAQIMYGTDQQSLNNAFDTIADAIRKRFTDVTVDTQLTEYVDPVVEADADAASAATLNKAATDAGATVQYNADTRSYSMAFPAGYELVPGEIYSMTLKFTPNAKAQEHAKETNGAVAPATASATYKLTTATNGQLTVSDPQTTPITVADMTLTVDDEQDEPADEPTDEPTDQPADEPTEDTKDEAAVDTKPADETKPQAPANNAEAPLANTGSDTVTMLIAMGIALAAGLGTLGVSALRRRH
ncbi:vWA domain-containing protein [Bifidobacterium gallicum]|uniref:LPXTG-motif cell wall anchor domain protein n=1 Tax=Bifidobacterium gallicum DSM 20093 = LMG 11596 TaxID=561180 RepID=D1NW11_9BIFI|nr:vWA domain-containing protein [Bifidobacterium gallicum]EFA22297.1 LPXTG-motif cell wall anchor domain protein [Bifidobacterium gallicum DSM 20093 = LMG 11596]KFI60024.1 putative von Willebrand factor type A domain protein [Bifidobacterium gallicum DSM 20093 = LMG 11596]